MDARARRAGAFALAGAVVMTGYLAGVSNAEDGTASNRDVPRVESRLEKYPGFRVAQYQLDEAQFEREEATREGLTQACMSRAGFKYSPVLSQVVSAAEVDSMEFLDPNDAYVDSLSASDRARYFEALLGAADPTYEGELDPEKGCLNQSLMELPGVYAMDPELRRDFDAMRRDMRADPAWRAAEATAGECLSSSGLETDVAVGTSPELADANVDANRAYECEAARLRATEVVRIAFENAFAAQHRRALDARAARIDVGMERVKAWESSHS